MGQFGEVGETPRKSLIYWDAGGARWECLACPLSGLGVTIGPRPGCHVLAGCRPPRGEARRKDYVIPPQIFPPKLGGHPRPGACRDLSLLPKRLALTQERKHAILKRCVRVFCGYDQARRGQDTQM